MRVLIRPGENPLDAYYRAHMERIEDQQKIARIVLEAGCAVPKMAGGATPAGDGRRLRGIPAIGRDVAGAIPGTRPGHNL